MSSRRASRLVRAGKLPERFAIATTWHEPATARAERVGARPGALGGTMLTTRDGRTFRLVEGVPYYRFRITFKTVDGKRHRLRIWSPGYPWVRTEVGRMLDERYGIDCIELGSCTIHQE